MKKNKPAASTIGLAFKKRNEPDTHAWINAAQAKVASSFDVDTLTNIQCLALDALGDSIACCSMAVALSLAPSDDDDNDNDFDFFPSDDLECSYPQVMKTVHIHMSPDYYPVDLPYDLDLDALHLNDDELVDSIPTILEPSEPSPTEDSQLVDTSVANRVCSFPPKVTQGDSGANRGVSNKKDLLLDYQEIVPFVIGTIGTETILVIGVGYMMLPTLKGCLERIKTYYSPKASGSIMSPARHVKASEKRLC